MHWRSDTKKRHVQVVSAVAALGVLEHVVVVRSCGSTAGEKIERRRRKVLERLFYELTSRGVGHVIVESRGPADDRRDADLLDYLRRGQLLPASVHLDHCPGPLDPLLWVPDAVCGAVAEARWNDASYLDELKSSIVIVEA